MARKTIYCAQAFWRPRGRLEGGQVHQFLDEGRALEGGEILAKSAPGAAVFSLTGEPDVDYWEEPKLLATWGDVPAADAFDQTEAA